MSTLLLFTKKFPYSHQETYLFNELPFLIDKFERVIIIPHDEFEYLPEHNRIKDIKGVEVYELNKQLVPLTVYGKLKREYVAWYVMLFELLKGRDKLNHLKNFKRVLSQARYAYNAAISLKKYIKTNKLNTVIFYNYWLHRGVVIGGVFNRFVSLVKYPIISRAHSFDVYHKDWFVISPTAKYVFMGFETWKVHSSDAIFAISSHGLNHFLRVFPALKTKFKLARLGVFSSNNKQIAENFNSKKEELLFVSCSNIDNNKRIYLIPQIISFLSMKVRWVHFGPGEEKDIERVKQEIKNYNLQDRCSLAGLKTNAEIIEYYKNNEVDLILNLSRIEGIPVALMEAASFGIPMLATKTVGNPEIVNNDNGFLIDVDFNPEEIADRLNAHFKDTSGVLKKREAAYKTFDMHYNASKNYTDFVNTISQFANAS